MFEEDQRQEKRTILYFVSKARSVVALYFCPIEGLVNYPHVLYGNQVARYRKMWTFTSNSVFAFGGHLHFY